jgi:DUF218 domain-containing protein
VVARDDLAVVVLGCSDPRYSQSRAVAARRVIAERRPSLVICCGRGSEAAILAHGLGEVGCPVVLEEQSRSTSENLAHAERILTADPQIRRVVVVSSWWHVRAGLFARLVLARFTVAAAADRAFAPRDVRRLGMEAVWLAVDWPRDVRRVRGIRRLENA